MLEYEMYFLALASEVDKVVGELSVELLKLRRTQVKQNVRMETHFKSKFLLFFLRTVVSEIEKLVGELSIGMLKTKRKQEQYEVRMEAHHNSK